MAIVLLHGFTGSSLSWGDAIVDGLSSVSGEVLLVDLPGHGRNATDTDSAEYTLDRVERDVDDVVGDDPFDLVGYSMGGRIALAYAVRNPGRVRRLILESASPGLETDEEQARRRAEDETLARMILEEGMEAFVERWERLPLFETQRALPGAVLAAQRARRLLNREVALAASLRFLGTGSLPSYWDSLEELTCPTLLVAGELDAKFRNVATRMAGRIPDVQVAFVAGAGHAVHLERPHAWIEAVTGFLSGGREEEAH